jgi:acyl carrier protein
VFQLSDLEKFNKYVCQIFQITKDDLKDSATPDDIDDWDSVTHMDLMALFEEEWALNLDVDEITEMTSIGLMKETLRKHGVKV